MKDKKRVYHSVNSVLVAGGAGFIGSHLIKKIVAEGSDVICLDNFFTGTKQNIEEFLKNKKFELCRHDINEEVSLQVDQIYNLACPASPIHYQHDPITTFKTSVNGSLNLLKNALKVGASTTVFLFISILYFSKKLLKS